MSLKSRKSIDSIGPDYHDEVSVSFRREENKTYTKVTKTTRRDRKNGQVKEMKRLLPIEEGPFEVTKDSENHDEKIQYEDINGDMMFIYLKKINTPEK
tara:strand:- start:1128 stop:1421 length:294 start_codon:yes stop_codon:yes gene_type:complete